jgi:hypothetical protein
MLLVVAFIVYKMLQSSRPEGFAREIAKTQKFSYLAFVQKYPNAKKEEIYKKVIITRPGYDMSRARIIIKLAKQTAKEVGVKFNFKLVVLTLVACEYTSRTGNSAYPVMENLKRGVRAASIPENW